MDFRRYLEASISLDLNEKMVFVAGPRQVGKTTLSASGVDPSLVYFRERLKIPWVYKVLMQETRDVEKDGVRSLPARQFLGALV